MTDRKLHLYTIMPLNMDHIDEICEDIRIQSETGVASCALFCMTMVPEGNPPTDKAGDLCKKYDAFREKLSAMGIPNGVLVQATIGHGWKLGAMFPYQQYIDFNSGTPRNTVCPMDEGFHDYLRYTFSTIASHNPDCIMVDDDFRLIGRAGQGCGCPLHMAEFNRRAGTNYTREELWALFDKGGEKAETLGRIMEQVSHDSLIDAAKIMREAIDSVNPKLPGSFCCVGNDTEHAAEIAKILAGDGNPTVVRINNGTYTAPGARGYSTTFLRAAHQIAKLYDKTDVILAETDTCPQNRYSTGAMQLHTHFTGTILEGAKGAKHWITRLGAYEPESGRAYRKKLAKYRGFYEALADIVPTLTWRGCRIPVSSKIRPAWSKQSWDTSTGWSYCVLERLGLPMFFSAKDGGALFLNGTADRMFDDEEMKKLLSGPVFLASDTAKHLIDRGFGEYLGVNVREWNGKTPSSEQLYINGNRINVQVSSKELVPLSDETVVDSMVLNVVGKTVTELFPGTAIYKNSLGGTVYTFCGTPLANYSLTEAFSFLNYSRKQQLIRMLKAAGELPVYHPGDEEVYMRAADMADGGLFAAVFNLGLDPIEELQLVVERDVTKMEQLMPDGSRRTVKFSREGDVYTLDCAANTLDPAIVFIY